MKNIQNFFNLVIKEIELNLSEVKNLRLQKQKKDDGSYVTKGDLLIQASIFKLFHDNFKDSFIYSEELSQKLVDQFSYNYVAILDPIDGTENFLSGLPEWGIGMSIYKKEKHQGSLIYLPDLNLSLQSGDKLEYFDSRIIGLSSTIKRDSTMHLIANNEYRIMGCSMYNMYNTIKGSFASFKNINGVNAWDLLPGANLALEHGLKVKINGNDYKGEFLTPSRKYTVEIFR